jgi:hypothetical protein
MSHHLWYRLPVLQQYLVVSGALQVIQPAPRDARLRLWRAGGVRTAQLLFHASRSSQLLPHTATSRTGRLQVQGLHSTPKAHQHQRPG